MAIRVLIVDDSFFMRSALEKILQHPEIEVVGTARDGKQAVEKVIELNPDLVTMDIEMPVMNGIDALKEIMKINPVPVLMVSSVTTDGADATIECLSLGAIDFITKRQGLREMDSIKSELIEKIVAIGSNSGLKNMMIRNRLLSRMNKNSLDKKIDNSHLHLIPKQDTIKTANDADSYKVTGRKSPLPTDIEVIAIGISTGGPNSLYEIIPYFNKNIPVPIIIAQHMPPLFTKSLSDRLNSKSEINISEAITDAMLKPGSIYIAQGGKQIHFTKRKRILIDDDPVNELFKPSVNIMLESLMTVYGNKILGIIMTGMGSDGKNAMIKLNHIGGYIIAQDPSTCVIAGMPKSVIDAGVADKVCALHDIPKIVNEMFGL